MSGKRSDRLDEVRGIDSTNVGEALKAAGLDAAIPDYRMERVLGEPLTYG